MDLSPDEKGILLQAARESINSLFDDTNMSIIEFERYPKLNANAGAFVTLTINNDLRGCVGFITSAIPLYQTICEAAKHAAVNDPRFSPVTQEELKKLNIEISVLSQPFRIEDFNDIKLGTYGLILDEAGKKTILLPQVATEHKYDIPRFLGALCEKAGLARDTWLKRNLEISGFTAAIFSEAGKRKRTYEHT